MRSIYFLWVALLLVSSCKKFVEIAPPVSKIENSEVFSNDQATTSAALGLYADVGSSSLYVLSGGMTVYPGLTADELIYTSPDEDKLSFQNDDLVANDGYGIYSSLWVPAYKYIYTANAVIEGIEQSKLPADSIKNQVKGEMLVVRALNYFCLVNLFGKVPLELTTDYISNESLPRTPIDSVYAQLNTDLEKAEGLLNTGYVSTLKARPNKWTATALLSRVYLYEKDWTDAESKASDIINSGDYGLESNLDNVFSQTSNETIWQIASDNHNTAEGRSFIPHSSTTIPSYALSPFLLSSFEDNDLRVSNWMHVNTINGRDYHYPYKYKNPASSPVTEFYVVFRLAEQYLIRAEARAQLNELSGARSDLNMIRSRAGLPNTTAPDQSSLLAAIARERQTELFCEWGQRFLDLKRTGLADQILGAEKAPNWQSTDSLYPIPKPEMLANPFLMQNEGY